MGDEVFLEQNSLVTLWRKAMTLVAGQSAEEKYATLEELLKIKLNGIRL